jgi:hypothetical protein
MKFYMTQQIFIIIFLQARLLSAVAQDMNQGMAGGELIFQSGFEPESRIITWGQGIVTLHTDADIIGVDHSLSGRNDWVKDLDHHPDIGDFMRHYQGGDASMRFAMIIPDPDGVSDFNPLKLYTSKGLIDYMHSRGKTLQIYWDDFKLWKGKRPGP